MAERALFTRLGVKDADKAVAELKRFGDRGEAALKKVETATTPLNRGLGKLDDAVRSSGLSMNNLAARAGPVGGVLAALGPAGVAAAAGIAAATVAFVAFGRAVDNADNLAKTADRLAITVEALQQFRFGAQIAGIEAGQFDASLEKLVRSVGEAVQGTGAGADAFKALGISVRDAGGAVKSTDVLLLESADALNKLGSNAERGVVSVDLFGRAGVRMLNFLNLGSKGIEELADRADELGIVLSNEAARGAEETADALAIFGSQIDISVDKILLSFAPAVSSMIGLLSDFIVTAANFELFGGGTPEASKLGKAALLAEIDDLTAEIADRQAELRELIASQAGQAVNAMALGEQQFLQTTLANMQADLDNFVAEAKARGLVGLTIDVPAPPGLSDAERTAMLEELDKLRGALDPIVKLEQDRAKALAVVAENSAALSDSDRLEFEAEINELFDTRLEALQKLAEKQDTHASSVDKTRTEYEKLIASLDKVAAAEQALDRDTEILSRAFDSGVIDITEFSTALDLLSARYDKARAAADGLTTSSRNVTASGAQSLRSSALGFDNIFESAIRRAVGNVVGGGGSGGFDFSSIASGIGGQIQNRIFDRALDRVFDSFGASSAGGGGGFPSFNPTSLFNGLSDSISGAIGSTVASLFPAQAAAAGGAIFGAEAGIAVQSGLSAAGGASLAGAAAGPLAIAAVAIFALSQLIGKDIDYPFALGEVQVKGGRAESDALNELDGGPIKEIGEMQDALAEALNGFFDGIGATLSDIDDLVRIGFSSGRKSILPKGFFAAGITARGDFASGADFTGIEEPEEALARALQIGISKAISEGIVEGLTEAELGRLELAAGNLRASPFTSLEDTVADIDFAATFGDFVFEVEHAGDALALQSRSITEGVKAFASEQEKLIADFKEKAERLFAPLDELADGIRTAGAALAGFDPHISDGINSPGDIEYTVIRQSKGGGIYEYGAGFKGLFEQGNSVDSIDLQDLRQVETRKNPTTRKDVFLPSFRTFGTQDQEHGQLTTGALDSLELDLNGTTVHLIGGELGGFDKGTRDTFRLEGTMAEIRAERFQDAHGIEQLVFNTEHLTNLLEANGISTTPADDDDAPTTTAELEEARDTLKQYARGLIDQVVGLESSTDAMTAWHLRLYEGTEQINALGDVLEEAGLTAAEATTAMAEGVARLAAEVTADFNKEVGRQFLAATNPAALAMADQLEVWADMRDQAEAVGGDMDMVNSLIEAQAKALTGESEARRENITALGASVASLKAASDGLEQTRFGLVHGAQSSLLAPTEKISGLEKAFAAAIAEAEAGDVDAARQAQTLGTQLFNLSRDVFATGAAGVAIQRNVADELGRVGGELRTQASIAEDQLSALEAIEANTRGGSAPSASSSRNFGTNAPTRARMLADLFPEFTGDFGGSGLFPAFFSSVGSSDPRRAIGQSIIEQISFAGGGNHAGGLRFVGERGVELEATGASRILSNSDLRGMLNGGGRAGDPVTHGLLSDMLTEFRRFGRRLLDHTGRLDRIETTMQPAIGARV